LLWSILWISRDKLRQVNDSQGKSSFDENQGSIRLLFLNSRIHPSATVKECREESIMESLRTVSYILIVVATFAATWFVSSL
jgi:hypothetical protein